MKYSRRAVIESALLSALAAATPKSLFSAAQRSIPAKARFLIVSLRDGRRLAIDRWNENKAFLLTRKPAPNGEYRLSKSGILEVHDGILRSLKERGECTGYRLSQEGESVVVTGEEGPVMRIRVTAMKLPRP